MAGRPPVETHSKLQTSRARSRPTDTKHTPALSLTENRIHMLPLALLRGGQGHPVVRPAHSFIHCPTLLFFARVCFSPPSSRPHPSSHPTHSALQLVELKSGETYNGHLVQCDSWMNMHLKEVRHVDVTRPSASLLFLICLLFPRLCTCTHAPTHARTHSMPDTHPYAGHMYVERCGQVYADARGVRQGQHSQVLASAG